MGRGRPANKIARAELSDRFLEGRKTLPALGDYPEMTQYLKTATQGQLLAACEDVEDLKKLLDMLEAEQLPLRVKTFVDEIIARRKLPPRR